MMLKDVNSRDVSERLKTLYHERINPKLSMLDIENATGIKKGTLNTYFNRGSIPSVIHAWVLCDYFDRSIYWLITGKEPVTNEDPIQNEIIRIVESQSNESRHQILKIVKTFEVQSQDQPKGGAGSGTRAG